VLGIGRKNLAGKRLAEAPDAAVAVNLADVEDLHATIHKVGGRNLEVVVVRYGKQ
jgi:hypothetical protein